MINPLSPLETNFYPIHTQKKCWFQIFLLMAMLSRLKFLEKQLKCQFARGADFLGYYGNKLLETTRIDNNSVTVQSAHILLGEDDSQYFETSPKKSQYQCTKWTYFFRIWCTAMSIQEKNHRSDQTLPPPGNSIYAFKWMVKPPMRYIVPSHVHWLKWLINYWYWIIWKTMFNYKRVIAFRMTGKIWSPLELTNP